MRVKFLSGICLGQGVDAFAGDVRDVIDPLGRELLLKRKAILYTEEAISAVHKIEEKVVEVVREVEAEVKAVVTKKKGK